MKTSPYFVWPKLFATHSQILADQVNSFGRSGGKLIVCDASRLLKPTLYYRPDTSSVELWITQKVYLFEQCLSKRVVKLLQCCLHSLLDCAFSVSLKEIYRLSCGIPFRVLFFLPYSIKITTLLSRDVPALIRQHYLTVYRQRNQRTELLRPRFSKTLFNLLVVKLLALVGKLLMAVTVTYHSFGLTHRKKMQRLFCCLRLQYPSTDILRLAHVLQLIFLWMRACSDKSEIKLCWTKCTGEPTGMF